MFVATLVLAIVFAVLLVVSAGSKLAHAEFQMATLRTVGFPEERASLLAAAEIAGAAGLLVGLWCWPIGVAAAVGLFLYFVGAVAAHLLKRDWNITASGLLLVVAVAALVLRLSTL
jgi:hypothetical protein